MLGVQTPTVALPPLVEGSVTEIEVSVSLPELVTRKARGTDTPAPEKVG